jgi:hypothetical protein
MEHEGHSQASDSFGSGMSSAAERMRSAVSAVLAVYPPLAVEQRAGRYAALCEAAARALELDGGSVTLISREGDSALLASSDPRAESLAELQYATGDGPTAEVTRDGIPVLAGHLDHSRWPVFAPAAQELGVCAVFVVPLQLGAIGIGVACLHRDRPGRLSAPQLDAVEVWLGAILEAVLSDLDQAPSVVGWLSQVDGHETTVHQATGMVLVQLGVQADEALLRLRAHAYLTGRSLSDVATDVVERRLSFRADGEVGQ